MRAYCRIHRVLGIGSVIFLLLLIITGVLLQHSHQYGLDTNHVPASAAKWLYGIEINISKSYQLDNHRISHAGNFLYLDGRAVPYIEVNNLQGAIEGNDDDIWIIADNKLWIISEHGEVVDELSALSGLPGMVTKIGRDKEEHIVIGGLHNNWRTQGNTNHWEVQAGHRDWSMPDNPSGMTPAEKENILVHAGKHLISIERLLLDLHSGRLFGIAGVIIIDAAALLLLFLSITGLVLWFNK